MRRHPRRAGGTRAGTGLIVAALATVTAAAVTAVAAVLPDVVAAPETRALPVDLTAVVTPGSATNWNANGIDDFYGIDWNAAYGPTVVATFHLLQDWIQVAGIDAALRNNPQPNLVLSSGRGAGNASALISKYVRDDDPTLRQTEWILDNNIDRPNGGYASRLPFFALVVVNPVPTPTDTGARIIDVGYEYAWNSDVPAYVTNVVALLNSITEYAYRYRKQDSITLPDEVLADDAKPGHYIVDTDGTVGFSPLSPDNTTVYVTYRSRDLAMLRPLRDFGGSLGNLIADAVEPVLKVIVDAGYPDNNPVGAPDVYTPMKLFAPAKVLLNAVKQIPGAIEQGIANVKADLAAKPTTTGAATTMSVAADPVEQVPAGPDTKQAKSTVEKLRDPIGKVATPGQKRSHLGSGNTRKPKAQPGGDTATGTTTTADGGASESGSDSGADGQ